MEPVLSKSQLNLNVTSSDGTGTVNVKVKDRKGKEVAKLTGSVGEILHITIPNVQAWSPNNPYLYDLDITLKKNGKKRDEVSSYFGMRSIEVKKVDGYPHIFL